MPRLSLIACLLIALAVQPAHADDLLYTYEGDVLPYDAGFVVFQTCDPPCAESLGEFGFALQWTGGGDAANYDVEVSRSPQPHFGTLWVEWRFRSDLPRPLGDDGCDGRARVQYRSIVAPVSLHGNSAISFDGGVGVTGMATNSFYTLRFESRDGTRYTYAVDGKIFINRVDPPPEFSLSSIQFGGFADCPAPGGGIRNEWDFIRYGTISDGEVIVAANPPAGILDATQYPALDRFAVTFDQPAFVYIDQITVTTTSGDAPQVLWTKRLDNGPPNVVQVVLDRPLPLNATTTFTFDDGVASSVVEYTYVELGACCGPDGACVDGIQEPECTADGGLFVVGESCGEAQACCFGGQCAEMVEVCCDILNGHAAQSPLGKEGCENDADNDGIDGACGDQCPMDENKTLPGICGCGVADLDSDGDTVADCLDLCPGQDDLLDSDADTIPDCLDQCPGEDDRIDDDENGTPDCAQFQPIPTASTWGLGILALLLLIAAKLRSSVFPSRDRKGVVSISSSLCPSVPSSPPDSFRHSRFAIFHSSSPLTKGGWASAQGGGRSPSSLRRSVASSLFLPIPPSS